MKADLVNREPQRLAWWEARGLHHQLRERRRGGPVRILHDGPPYSNGHLHMGTAANNIWKDAAVRTWSLLGYDSPFVPGWDNHGMPIENQVTREARNTGTPSDRMSIRRRCRAYAAEWVGIQREELVRLGVWGDWANAYLTMHPGFEAVIVETFAALAAQGYIQRGMRSIHWCPTDRTALAEAEIEYQDDPSPSILVAFPLRHDPAGLFGGDRSVAAMAWTTTPWTLPANLGLMVDPSAEYALVDAANTRYVLAASRLEAVRQSAGWTAAKVMRTFKGRELIGIVFEAPWGGDSRVVDGTPYVTLEDGTGIVHTAPGHGKEDFAIGQRFELGLSCPVDEAGRFTAGAEPFVGRSVLEVNDDIIAWLRERGRLVAASTFTHSYPHCWRCRQPVIFRATEQWFLIIDHLGLRDRALELIEHEVRWDPPGSRNRIRESVRVRPDWCLSRQRAWGVGIPAVYCESCGEAILDAGVMRLAADLTREHSSDAWYERPVGDFLPPGLTCPKCGAPGPFRKETDILDVWFDSGNTHRAVPAMHPELRETWRRAHAEGGRIAYLEGPDQHRGWFNSSLMVSTGAERRAPYTDVYTHGWVLDQQGRAMHKSLGNVIAPMEIVKKNGAEIVRWWALATDWRSDVRVGDEILQRVSEAYRKVRNTFRFLLGNLSDFQPAEHALPAARLLAVDRAFCDALQERLREMRGSFERMEFHRALDALLNFCTVDLSAVLLDVTKDRLYTLVPADPARRSAQTALWRALHDLCIASSPLIVFTAEEVWQSHPGLKAERESVHLADWPAAAGEATGDAWRLLLELREAVNATLEPMRAAKTIASTSEAAVRVRVRAAERSRLEPFAAELPGFLLVAEVELESAPAASGEAFSAAAVPADPSRYKKCERCWKHRDDVSAEGLCGRCRDALARGAGATAAT